MITCLRCEVSGFTERGTRNSSNSPETRIGSSFLPPAARTNVAGIIVSPPVEVPASRRFVFLLQAVGLGRFGGDFGIHLVPVGMVVSQRRMDLSQAKMGNLRGDLLGVLPNLYQIAMRRTETPVPAIRTRPPQMPGLCSISVPMSVTVAMGSAGCSRQGPNRSLICHSNATVGGDKMSGVGPSEG